MKSDSLIWLFVQMSIKAVLIFIGLVLGTIKSVTALRNQAR